jgi:hypothetical protein
MLSFVGWEVIGYPLHELDYLGVPMDACGVDTLPVASTPIIHAQQEKRTPYSALSSE